MVAVYWKMCTGSSQIIEDNQLFKNDKVDTPFSSESKAEKYAYISLPFALGQRSLAVSSW
ncbi:unnamed protein product [Heterobilharzia americana]|nr:unnamed protein product [Heterobilharzia americana]